MTLLFHGMQIYTFALIIQISNKIFFAITKLSKGIKFPSFCRHYFSQIIREMILAKKDKIVSLPLLSYLCLNTVPDTGNHGEGGAFIHQNLIEEPPSNDNISKVIPKNFILFCKNLNRCGWGQ
jgi:hypothetical protein